MEFFDLAPMLINSTTDLLVIYSTEIIADHPSNDGP